MKSIRKQIADVTVFNFRFPADENEIFRILNQNIIYSRVATPLWTPLVPFLRIILEDELTLLEKLTDD